MATSAFGQRFEEELRSLVSNDRNQIMFLRDIAADNKATESVTIVAAIQQHLHRVRNLL